jgi:hypothetical protein
MPDASGHIVNSATFEVRLIRALESDGLSAPARLADFFRQVIQPALDQALTTFAADGDYRIERLVIDLGTIERFPAASSISPKIESVIAKAFQGIEKPAAVSIPLAMRLRRGFISFLHTGQIPWDTPVGTLASFESEIQALKYEEIELLMEELKPLLSLPAVRRRLLAQFRIAFVRWLLEKLQPALPAALSAVAPRQHPGLRPSEQLEIQLQVAGRLPPGSSRNELTEAIRAQVRVLKAKEKEAGAEAAAQEHDVLDADDVAPAEDDTAASESAAKGIFVSQAGVVMLHPFIIRFFDRRGLLTAAHIFKNRGCREKAVHLLNFLATGRAYPEEQHTTVYKVLCGLDIHEPVLKNVDVADEDRQEAHSLLESAIKHWSRLKNTSPDGLRTAFLQRQGKLTRTQGGWHLTVEQRSIDILLGTLPWSLSVIQYPWLNQPVRVDWA